MVDKDRVVVAEHDQPVEPLVGDGRERQAQGLLDQLTSQFELASDRGIAEVISD